MAIRRWRGGTVDYEGEWSVATNWIDDALPETGDTVQLLVTDLVEPMSVGPESALTIAEFVAQGGTITGGLDLGNLTVTDGCSIIGNFGFDGSGIFGGTWGGHMLVDYSANAGVGDFDPQVISPGAALTLVDVEMSNANATPSASGVTIVMKGMVRGSSFQTGDSGIFDNCTIIVRDKSYFDNCDIRNSTLRILASHTNVFRETVYGGCTMFIGCVLELHTPQVVNPETNLAMDTSEVRFMRPEATLVLPAQWSFGANDTVFSPAWLAGKRRAAMAP